MSKFGKYFLDKFTKVLEQNNMGIEEKNGEFIFSHKKYGYLPLDFIRVKDIKELMGELTREWNLCTDYYKIEDRLKNCFSDFESLKESEQDKIIMEIQQNMTNIKNSAKDIFAQMVQRENFVINFYGSPGAGKSYAALKMQEYINRELGFDATRVVEYATELIQKEQFELLKNQPYVSTMQGRNLLEALSNLSNIAVSDSPIDLGRIYNDDSKQAQKVADIIEKTRARYIEIPIFIKHTNESLNDYSEVGRVHSKDESLEIEKKLLDTFSDKDFIIVERGLDSSLILAKVDEWCQNKFGVGFVEMLVDRNEIQNYVGVFPEPFENLQNLYELLGGKEIDNQSIWEKTIDYLQNNVDFNDKSENDMKLALSDSYRYDYAEEVGNNIKDKLEEIFNHNSYLEIKAEREDIRQGIFYFNLYPVYDVDDFKDALIDTLNDMIKEIRKEKQSAYLVDGSAINEALKFQKDIAELLATKMGIFIETEKYAPEPVSKFEEKLAEEIKNNVVI